jgi:hypothetical protein
MLFSIAAIGLEKAVNFTVGWQKICGAHAVRVWSALLAVADWASILAVSPILINRIFAAAT